MTASGGKKKREKFKIMSMTGFGKASAITKSGKITAEIKTLNHKSLSINCTPFSEYFFLDEKVKKMLEKKLHRGKVFVRIFLEQEKAGAGRVSLNEKLIDKYIKKTAAVRKKYGIKGELALNDLISLPGVLNYTGDRRQVAWSHIREPLKEALSGVLEFRKTEGAALARDLGRRLKKIERELSKIQKADRRSVREHRKKLRESFKQLPLDAKAVKNRIEEEVAVFARSCDISEEITRLEGHLPEFRKTLEVSRIAGKKLDFMAQEMQREINTIGSKASSFSISRSVISVKAEVEKIREQIRNIE
jgi:uncharacterized protein (TIGR00255 family)